MILLHLEERSCSYYLLIRGSLNDDNYMEAWIKCPETKGLIVANEREMKQKGLTVA